MVLTYNGQIDYTDMITFTGVPNIITVTPSAVGGSKERLEFTINSLTLIDLEKEYLITINGVTITGTTKIPGNKLFYISNLDTDIPMVVNSIVVALRESGLVNYDIYQPITTEGLTSKFIIEAKENGSLYLITYTHNLPDVTDLIFAGQSEDEFLDSKFFIDIYVKDKYLTTLEKNYYKQSMDFDLSGVLKSISKYDNLVPYSLNIYNKKDKNINKIGTIKSKIIPGYMCNQGNLFIKSYPIFALNVSRGTKKSVLNSTTLYTYLPQIPITVYTNVTSHLVLISYLREDQSVLYSKYITIIAKLNVCNENISLDLAFFKDASFIDINIQDVGTIRYRVIKPLDATSRCQRVYYHNSYGGVSFFDFTGQITENHKVDNETYTKNLYDFYKKDTIEQVKLYDKDISIVVTLKSHLMERDAVWQFNDLLGSQDVWTNINGKEYRIIITDCKVDETETGVWEATVTYTYSLV